jgi:hypothetical protein
LESPRTIPDSKELRWTGRPSEEQLLGSLERPVRPTTVSFEPPASRDWASAETATHELTPTTPGWRLQPRDALALAAVAAAVWLAVRGSESLPFHFTSPAAPASATEVFRTTLSPDRADALGPPRSTTTGDKSAGAKKDGKGDNHQNGDRGSRDSGGGQTTKPPADETDTALLEATVPGVGTVTVENPDLPDTSGVGVPDLPETNDVLPQIPTVSVLTVTLP